MEFIEHIQNLFNLAQDYWIFTMIIGVFSTFIESFLPVLPLVGIVSINAAIFGALIGLIISWIGSGLGTAAVFLVISKFNDNKLFNKLRNEKTEKAIKWMEEKGFKLLFIAYACPFVPSFLVTITSAFCKRSFRDFVPAMLAGKFIMFLVVSYIAGDIKGFITSPFKIALFIGIAFIAWTIGAKVNKSLDEYHDNHENVKDLKNHRDCIQ
ncbi:TVP38/TMEM64 family protein [Romboutsia weinsteinii]|uniref:TVP38/TMEM64 family protein n=1 Tax=Romboutsia weinsteinii TaxID=2020949 RepID=UPI001FB16897|nr:VTT domain-containing protein [Romboutsia weinsteinii]